MQGKGQKSHPYLKAVIILAFVCAYMAVCAYFAPDMKIGEFRLSIVHIGTDSPESITVYTQDTVPARRQTDAPERDTMPPKVLLLGDSMIEGLAKPFGEYAKHNGFTLTAAIWYGSTTQTWAECDTLDSLMDKIRPQAVAVSLGGNELFIRHPERRAECIDRIMGKIGGTPFIWIGPPNWQKDTGINRVIRSCTGEYRFFDSSDMKLQRSDDGKHPTRYAARIWMDSIASWMRTRHDLTLRMDKPGKGIKSNTDIIIIAAKP